MSGAAATTTKDEAIPSTPQSVQDTSNHGIAETATASTYPGQMNELISFGEARELAQLRMGGITASPPEETKRPVAGTLNSSTRQGALPPLDPVYQRKAVNAMKIAIENGDQSPKNSSQDSGNESVDGKKKLSLLKRSKKIEKLNTWIEGSVQALSKRRQAVKDPHGHIAKEHAKIAMLYQSISATQEELLDVKQHITRLVQRMELEHIDLIPDIKTSVSTMQKLDKQLRNKLDKVRSLESKTKKISAHKMSSGSIPEPLELSENHVSDSSDSDSESSSDEEDTEFQSMTTTYPSPIVVKPYQPPQLVKPYQAPTPTKKRPFFSRPSTASKKSQSPATKPSPTMVVPQTRIIYVAEAKPQNKY